MHDEPLMMMMMTMMVMTGKLSLSPLKHAQPQFYSIVKWVNISVGTAANKKNPIGFPTTMDERKPIHAPNVLQSLCVCLCRTVIVVVIIGFC